MAVKVSSKGDSITIHLDHALAGRVDADLVAGCIEAALECCGSSGCCDGGISINAQCLATVAKHNEATRCVTSCLGCA